MIGYKWFRHIMAILVLLIVVNAVLINSIYNNLQLAFGTPVLYAVLACIFAVFFVGLEFTKSDDDPDQDLFTTGDLLLGLFAVLMFASNTLFTRLDNLMELWFWNAMFCTYAGWLIGVASLRYYIIREMNKS